MTTLYVEAEISFEALLKAVEQLSEPELERFVSQVIALQARHKAPSLPKGEADLLLKINRGLPANVQARYEALVARRKAETLTGDEHNELLRLTDQVEQLEAERMRSLATLARLRQTSLTALMEALGIQPPAYA